MVSNVHDNMTCVYRYSEMNSKLKYRTLSKPRINRSVNEPIGSRKGWYPHVAWVPAELSAFAIVTTRGLNTPRRAFVSNDFPKSLRPRDAYHRQSPLSLPCRVIRRRTNHIRSMCSQDEKGTCTRIQEGYSFIRDSDRRRTQINRGAMAVAAELRKGSKRMPNEDCGSNSS